MQRQGHEIRAETSADHAAVDRVLREAFGRPNEAELVATLRRSTIPLISLVAESNQQVIGHVLFTPMSCEPPRPTLSTMALAPLAVLPACQNRGVGMALVRAGLQACGEIGCGAVAVLGHPVYYRRFGFRRASTRRIRCEFNVPDEYFMVLELAPGALGGVTGLFKYMPEFAAV